MNTRIYLGFMFIFCAALGCAPTAAAPINRSAPSGPVLYDTSPESVYSALVEIISTAQGVAGYEKITSYNILGQPAWKVIWGDSGYWEIVNSDQSGGTLMAETTQLGFEQNVIVGIKGESFSQTFSVSAVVVGQQIGDTRKSQVILTGDAEASSLLEAIYDGLDKRFKRANR